MTRTVNGTGQRGKIDLRADSCIMVVSLLSSLSSRLQFLDFIGFYCSRLARRGAASPSTRPETVVRINSQCQETVNPDSLLLDLKASRMSTGFLGSRDPCGTRVAAAPLLAGSSKKQTTPLLRLASRRSSARRWPDDFRRPAPVLGRSMTGRNAASESLALGKSVPRRRRRLGSTGATAASPATLSAPRMAPGAVRDNTQHARHAAAAPTDWRAHPRGRRATNWTRFVVERALILTSRAGVVLRAAGSGDGVARLLARGHGSGGGGIGDCVCAGLDAERSARSCCTRRTLRLGPMLCRGRCDDVVLGSHQ